MADLLNFNVVRALDLDGYPVPGAQAWFYDSGTDDLRAVYADDGATVQHPSPIVADAEGIFPPVYVLGGSAIRAVVKDADGVMLTGYPQDPVSRVPASGSAASAIGFNPTADIPETNVQDAVERVQQNLIEPLVEYGLGVTGNATLLTNIDATNTPSGFYRYDGSTSGTFPSWAAAADGGIILVFRRTSSAGRMVIISSGGVTGVRDFSPAWTSWKVILDQGGTHSQAVWNAGTSTNVQGISPVLLWEMVKRGAIGVGQQWVNMLASRGAGVLYRNNTGRPISVSIAGRGSGTATFMVSADNVSWVPVGYLSDASNPWLNISAVVPSGHYYQLFGSVQNLAMWSELT